MSVHRLRYGFSMIELLVALMFVSFAFLPIYNPFRFGQRGTWSHEKEIVATNHAADLINFFREINIADLDKCFPGAKGKPASFDDSQLQDHLKKNLNLSLPPSELNDPDYSRKTTLIRYNGVGSKVLGIPGDWTYERSAVPNYLVTVEVDYKKKGMGEDKVTLHTIVMD